MVQPFAWAGWWSRLAAAQRRRAAAALHGDRWRAARAGAVPGLLPDLFREGKGVVVSGKLQAGGLSGPEVLAKHDENYMPPEAAHALKQAQPAKEQP
jgi:hypothetical protein